MEELSIGFTGTRQGMSEEQLQTVDFLITKLATKATNFHHGGCIGSDIQAAKIAQRIGLHIICHPSTFERTWGEPIYSEIRKPDDPLRRNITIVAESTWVIAAPLELREQSRGGTWQTIRRAWHVKKPLWIVYRDGSLRPVQVEA